MRFIKPLFARILSLLFYISLDVVTGAIIYIVSNGEANLTPGQLAIRILTAIVLANAIVGGPDIMIFWRESGRRITAEEERDIAVANADAAQKHAVAAEKTRLKPRK